MNVPDFPVTELFGCQPGYPLNKNLCPPGQGYHNGIDYGCPSGTPVIVNGVTIGISGATGAVTGPHCHVGKWVNGSSVNPGVGNGFSFKSAVVTDVNQDATNGKYVALNGDGARWVYLHMSDNSKVKVGQVLQGGSTHMPYTRQDYEVLAQATGIQYGKDFSYPDNLSNDQFVQFALDQTPKITPSVEKKVAESITGIPNVIGKDYNSPFVGKAFGVAYQDMVDFWVKQPKSNEQSFTILEPGNYKVN